VTFGYKLYLIVNYKCIQSIMKHNHSILFFTNREEEFEDTKGILRIIEEEQTTQWPKERDKRTNNDLQNICIKQNLWAH